MLILKTPDGSRIVSKPEIMPMVGEISPLH